MRLLILSVIASCAVCLGATCAIAQSGQWGQAQDQIPPFLTHIDRRHGNGHVYPDRGAVVRDLPPGAAEVNYAGLAYRFAGGVWYQALGPAYIVVAPPIGLMVPRLPSFATRFESGGKTYLYADDVFYRPRPGLGGYEVVNDPQDTAPRESQKRATSASALALARIRAPISVRTPAQAKSMTRPPAAAPGGPLPVVAALSNPTRVVIHPRNGQSADQQASDRYECYRFAVAQSGFDPLALDGGARADTARRSSDYSRAQISCLERRGYTVQ